ncbi:MAG TPA: Hsp70 family protein, partial [Ktedonobacteraceae bacterium]|nr:Hsp70 family protein [Ktedonobacteraceae bacterium]
EAELHAREDRERKEEIELRNRADSIAYQAERTLRDVQDKISSNLRSDVESKIQAVRDALSGTDVSRIRTTTTDLESTLQRIGQEIYSQAGASTGTGSSSAGQSGWSSGTPRNDDSGTVEGEYREVE